jgi:hypothetical protein
MRKLLPLLIAVVGLSSCGKEEAPPLTKEQIKHYTDSVTEVRIKDAEMRARRDLEFRLKIEAGAKTGPLVPKTPQNLPPPMPPDSL